MVVCKKWGSTKNDTSESCSQSHKMINIAAKYLCISSNLSLPHEIYTDL